MLTDVRGARWLLLVEAELRDKSDVDDADDVVSVSKRVDV